MSFGILFPVMTPKLQPMAEDSVTAAPAALG